MLRFHSPGIPIISKKEGILRGLEVVAELGLDGMEVLFTHGVNMNAELAEAVHKKAQQQNLTLSVHGPFWINLNSKDPFKIEASKNHILDTVRKAHEMGASSITFHAAFMHENSNQEIIVSVSDAIREVVEISEAMEIHDVLISPEVTGKQSQFGDIASLVEVASNFDNRVSLCVDFAHLYARTNGKENGWESFSNTLSKIEEGLGKEYLENLHIHMGGITYGEKGEKKHRTLPEETEFKWMELLEVLKEREVSGWVSVETPDIETSTKIAKEYYNSLH